MSTARACLRCKKVYRSSYIHNRQAYPIIHICIISRHVTIIWRNITIFTSYYSTPYFIDRFILTGMRYFNKVSTVPSRSSGEGRLEVKRWEVKKAGDGKWTVDNIFIS